MSGEFCDVLHAKLLSEIKSQRGFRNHESRDWTCTGWTGRSRKSKRSERKRRREYTAERTAHYAQTHFLEAKQAGLTKAEAEEYVKRSVKACLKNDKDCGSIILFLSFLSIILNVIKIWQATQGQSPDGLSVSE